MSNNIRYEPYTPRPNKYEKPHCGAKERERNRKLLQGAKHGRPSARLPLLNRYKGTD